ncbi:MFS transporter [Sphingomonas sp. C8-2]|uniref:Sugar phosphate permease n=1 Tax=Rhizorhabdus histidinilytica TaxID=439228 RepID=A0A1T5EJY5_9SPHN|nr:MFS transporter [Rhizorhabdus histidinilytica]QEH76790.1 MFS transporter [Sphingomonas sp. C8-2]SKB84216.1 Sugar phosphate permease [Rhizorhabdus histidinilytica]
MTAGTATIDGATPVVQPDDHDRRIEASITAKFGRRVMPILAIMCMVAWLDRQNIAFAKLQMVSDLGLSEYAYGLGASLFFLSYTLFQLPNSLLIARYGPVRFFIPATLGWGVITIGMAASDSPTIFYLLRFLLGVVEGGFYTGSIYLLTLWLPYERRAQANGILLGASLAANIIVGPLCGAMLDLDMVMGLRGWQWVFIATGLPSLLLALAFPLLMPPGPDKARFFTEEERVWLRERLDREKAAQPGTNPGVMDGLAHPLVLFMAVPVLAIGIASIGIIYWLPTIIADFGVSNSVNGWLNCIPWIAVVAGLVWWPRRAERRQERFWHAMIPLFISAVSAVLVPFASWPPLQLALLTLCTMGIFVAQPIIWSFPGRMLRSGAVAAMLAACGMFANVGAFIGQNLIPWIAQESGSTRAPMFSVAVMALLAALSAGYLVRRAERRGALSESGSVQ